MLVGGVAGGVMSGIVGAAVELLQEVDVLCVVDELEVVEVDVEGGAWEVDDVMLAVVDVVVELVEDDDTTA